MSGQKTWAKHYQDVWTEKAGDPRLPKWLRVACLAYGRHRANGHATFAQGDVALVLATVDELTGEVIPDANVSRAVGMSVEYGWLAKGSNARCLVVPAHAIGGSLGDPFAPCPVHGKLAARQLLKAA